MITKQQAEAKAEDDQKEGFRRWMNQPMTKAMLSLMPPCEHLEIVLQACYGAGFSTGSGSTAVMFIDSILDRPRR